MKGPFTKLKKKFTINCDDILDDSTELEVYRIKPMLYADKDPNQPDANVEIMGKIFWRKVGVYDMKTGHHPKVIFDIENQQIIATYRGKRGERLHFSNEEDVFKKLNEALAGR